MTFVQSVLLGIVQGVTEFLPISSSGHLILVPSVFKWEDQGLFFDVLLHVATLCVIGLYFFSDWKRILSDVVRQVRDSVLRIPSSRVSTYWGSTLIQKILVGSIPAVVVGLFYNDAIEHYFRGAGTVVVMLISVGVVMYLSERFAKKKSSIEEMSLTQAFLIGCAQAVALIPGTSRSGVTITAALFLGIIRADAARFSFLLSAPAILGAALLQVIELITTHDVSISFWVAVVGFVSAFLSGLISVAFLMKYLQKHSLSIFVLYRIALGVTLLFVFF